MKIAIVADDITGANDSGVQLARHGLKTAVLFDIDEENVKNYEAVVYDTDSRSINKVEAYNKVKQVVLSLKNAGFTNIFKKLDSTMRGNIGAEIDAVYDVLIPDFVMIAPGYPKNNRTILNSVHYLNGVPLGESEIAKDPKTPVTVSSLTELLENQTAQRIETITVNDLALGKNHIEEMLKKFYNEKIPYIIVDSTEETHLQQILNDTKDLPYHFAWAGSAGIANYLPAYYEIRETTQTLHIPNNEGPILTVIGSVNKNSRSQLKNLLDQPNLHSIAFESFKAVSSQIERIEEIERVYNEAIQKASEGLDIVIYSTAEKEDIEKAWKTGNKQNLSKTEISNEIVKALGSICSSLLKEGIFKGYSLTGGDTAKQFCLLSDIKGFELLDEIEIGVPISKFLGIDDVYVVTKAGGFGTEQVFINALQKLKGEQ